MKSIKKYILASAAVLAVASASVKSFANEQTFDFNVYTTTNHETTNKREIVSIYFVNAKGELLKSENETAKRVLMTTNLDKNPITYETLNAAVRTFSFDASLDQVGDLQVEDNVLTEGGIDTHRVTKFIVIDKEQLTAEQTAELYKQMEIFNQNSDVVNGDTKNSVNVSTTETTDVTEVKEEKTESTELRETNPEYRKKLTQVVVIDHVTGELVKNKDGQVYHVIGDNRFVEAEVSKYLNSFKENHLIKEDQELSNTFTKFNNDVESKDGLLKVTTHVAVVITKGSQMPTELKDRYMSKAEELNNNFAKSLKDHSIKDAIDGKLDNQLKLKEQTTTTNQETPKQTENQTVENKTSTENKPEATNNQTTQTTQDEQDKKLLEDKKKLSEEKPKTQFAKTNVKNYTAIFTALLAVIGVVTMIGFNKKKTEK